MIQNRQTEQTMCNMYNSMNMNNHPRFQQQQPQPQRQQQMMSAHGGGASYGYYGYQHRGGHGVPALPPPPQIGTSEYENNRKNRKRRGSRSGCTGPITAKGTEAGHASRPPITSRHNIHQGQGQKQPKKPKKQQDRSQCPIIKGRVQGPTRTVVEGGPNTNDVVCYSITTATSTKGIIVIQPNSTHQGNKQFCDLVKSRAQSYQKATDGPGSKSKSDEEEEQQKIARSIATDIDNMGGRFLVWNKHHNNGSWCVVDNDDVQKISRYALLKQAEAESKSIRLQQQQQQEKAAQILQSSEKACFSNNEKENNAFNSSNHTIISIIKGINIHDDDDQDDIWSLFDSSGEDSNETQKPCCWQYKILLP